MKDENKNTAMHPLNTKRSIDEHLVFTCSPAASDADFCGDDALTRALGSLDGREITGSVTIALQDGVYGASAPLQEIQIIHPDAARIRIQGHTGDAAAFTMSAPPDTSAHTFTLDSRSGLHDASDFAPGGGYRPFIIYIAGSAGNDGPYTVTSARNENGRIVITVRETIYSNVPGGTAHLLPSNRCQLVFRTNVNGIAKRSPGGCRLSGLRLIGKAYGNRGGLVCFSGAEVQAEQMIVDGFHIQYWAAYGGRIGHPDPYGDDARANVAQGGTAGFYAYHHGEIHAPRCVAGQTKQGFSADTFGHIYAGRAVAAGTGDAGFHAAIHGLIFAHQAAAHNNGVGCRSVNQGTIFREGLRAAGNGSDYDPAGRPPQLSLTGGRLV